MENNHNVMDILKMIEDGEILPHEGYAIIQQINNRNKAAYSVGDFGNNAGESRYKAVMLSSPGDVDDIEVVSIYPVDPDYNEVQILVKAFSLNFGDLLCVKGLYPTMPEYPFVPGFEVAGVVTKVGKGVSSVEVGDEVIALTDASMGGHSYILNTDEKFVFRKPGNISFEEGCSFPVVFMTIYNVFEKANMQKGEKILIQTAAGGTGLIAVQMALQCGAEIYATAGSDKKLAYLQNMGVHHVINYREEDFYDAIMEETNGYGVDVVINTLSGDAIQKGLDLLAPGGRYIEIAMSGLKTSSNVNLSNLVDNQVFYSVDFRKLIKKQPELIARYFEKMFKVLMSGEIKPTISRVFDFDKIKDAYEYLKNRENIGKVVVRVPENDNYMESSRDVDFEPKIEKHEVSNDIAIIGMAGRFPGAMNIEEFWKVLAAGKDCITEVPKERWDIDEYYDPDVMNYDATNCRCGGFLSHIDKFDPMFFNMSGKEAEMSDPQLRIFLEESWKALEDAGYASKAVSNSKCGVFVGVGSGDYMSLLLEKGVKRVPQTFLGNNCAILAARISYLLNLKGPSVAVDTACSSSLVAIHLGCQSILLGESNMVIAGGSFIRSTPDFYISSSNSGMLSPDGKCKSFDNDSDGFVPGEGVGVVILKKYEAAVRDKDHIYGVIKGLGINHDGKTNGITAPSTISQTDLEVSVYDKVGINPETISYIETHGTGTKLGDPIEIEALTNAFEKYTNKKQFCAIGSVKTNMGHAVTAAGVSSIIKVLLMMKHKKYVPSLNFDKENEHINFKESPFYVNTQFKEWNTMNGTPRRAAVSSFGFSGTNAHVVIEEPPQMYSAVINVEKPAYFVAVSAKSKTSFNKKVDDLLLWLKEEGSAYSMNDICYTLLERREHFSIRAAIVVSGMDELIEKIGTLKESVKDIYDINLENKHLLEKQCDDMIIEVCSSHITPQEYNGILKNLAEMYEKGCEIKWNGFYEKHATGVVPMPVYPFADKTYWVPENEAGNSSPKNTEKVVSHPMIGKNLSTEHETEYSNLLTGNEFYLDDHVIGTEKILPGVAYLEMARALGNVSQNCKVRKLRNIVWLMPIRITDSSLEVKMRIIKNGQDFRYEIYSQKDNMAKDIHNHGSVVFESDSNNQSYVVNLDEIKNRCRLLISGNQFYPSIKARGMFLGESFQVVEETYGNDYEALALIRLNSKNKKDFSRYLLHPSIMDGALQSALMIGDTESLYVPYSIGEVEIYKPLEEVCYAYTVKTKIKNTSGDEVLKFTIQLINQKGEALVAIKDFIPRPFAAAKDDKKAIINSSVEVMAHNLKTVDTVKTTYNPENITADEIVKKELEKDIIKLVAEVLHIDEEDIKLERNLSEYGFESLNFNDLSSKINNFYRIDIMASVFFEHDTLKSFSNMLFEEYGEKLKFFYDNRLRQSNCCSVESDKVLSINGKNALSVDDIKERFKDDILKMVAKALRLNYEDIKPERNMSEYGFDSLMYNELSSVINDKYNLDVIPAVFFEHQNLGSFIGYLFEDYFDKISMCYKEKTDSFQIEDDSTAKNVEEKGLSNANKVQRGYEENTKFAESSCEDEPIAIIGISGVFPQSENVEEFWNNLEAEKDLITKIPMERWLGEDLEGLTEIRDTDVKWGGFIKDVDKFDSLFFGISPKEAQMMDPQQRIFLETIWKTIEDAGYKVSDLSGTNTGIFAGVATSDYGDLLKDYTEPEALQSTGISRAVLVNRISYLLNIHGPSEPIDTACSSALVAIHRAVQGIRNGECGLAIAGGVNIITSPALYISFSKSGMLSSDGRCKTFDKRADGYVRGEGSGAVLLKPLSKAKADGDHIYAVIKGTAINHGGRTSSLTAPNPNAQAELIINAWDKAGVDPSTINYIEAHGTGTALGDPIEINGLKKAFKHLYSKWGRDFELGKNCGVGSVKTNIGHLETAAGIAGLAKVIFAMKNGKIPGNLHFEELNPYIKIDETPFYIVDKTIEWKRLKDENGLEIPRRAGISSFGFGGANAHIALEEYIEEETAKDCLADNDGNQIVVISAKNSKALKRYARDLVAFIDKQWKNAASKMSLTNFAFTTQVGRDEMDERLAVIVSSFDELKDKLKRFVEGDAHIQGLCYGNINSDKADGTRTYNLPNEIDLDMVARDWVSGVKIDWMQLNAGKNLKRISQPSYPFARERHWVDTSKGKKHNQVEIKRLHPLIESNISTLKEEKFITYIKDNNLYMRDHVIGYKKVLPGAAYVEMVRAAGEIASERPVKKLKDVYWMRPVIFDEIGQVNESHEIRTSFDIENDELVATVKTCDDSSTPEINFRAKIECEDGFVSDTGYVDIDSVKSDLQDKKTGSECYELFRIAGMKYGDSLKVLKELLYSENQALSYIELPDTGSNGAYELGLNPCIVDGAFQTIIGLVMNTLNKRGYVYIPYCAHEIEICGVTPSKCYVLAAKSTNLPYKNEEEKYDILITDILGKVVVKIMGFLVRLMEVKDETKDVVKQQNEEDEIMRELLEMAQNGEIDIEELENYIGGKGDEQ